MSSESVEDLRRRVADLEAAVSRLRQENEALRQGALVSHAGAIWRRRHDGGFDGPYCAACWASSGALAWLVGHGEGLDEVQCPTCRRPTRLPHSPA